MKKRGFTLIELLVVIAIIGVLAAAIISRLDTARSKSDDAAIKQDLSQMAAQAELGRIPDVSSVVEYGLTCSTTPSSWPSNSGALFRDAFTHSDEGVNSAICVIPYEPASLPPYPCDVHGCGIGMSGHEYQVTTPGSITAVVYGPPPPGIQGGWAAAVRLSNGSYFCVDGYGQAITTPNLTISRIDYRC